MDWEVRPWPQYEIEKIFVYKAIYDSLEALFVINWNTPYFIDLKPFHNLFVQLVYLYRPILLNWVITLDLYRNNAELSLLSGLYYTVLQDMIILIEHCDYDLNFNFTTSSSITIYNCWQYSISSSTYYSTWQWLTSILISLLEIIISWLNIIQAHL